MEFFLSHAVPCKPEGYMIFIYRIKIHKTVMRQYVAPDFGNSLGLYQVRFWIKNYWAQENFLAIF